MPRRYSILDVFTDRPLAGNPLAVVLDGDGLDDRRMQAIAAEFNLSETVFVKPAANPAHRASIRIFTPKRELPFAGHPTVGTAVRLAIESAGESPNSRDVMFVMEEQVGPVRCGVKLGGAGAGYAVFDLPRLPAATSDPTDREAIALALGLLPNEVGFENHAPSGFDAGVPYSFVPVRDLDAVGRARPHPLRFGAVFGGSNHPSAFVYTRETAEAGRHFHARMFAPTMGIPEDPATGSAAAAFAGVISRFDQPPGGSHRYVIEQGFEMGRPSLITLEVDMDGGSVAAARIGGDAVVVAEGTIEV